MDPTEALKAALWLHVGRIVDAETQRLAVNATPQFIGALTELVWTQTRESRPPAESRPPSASLTGQNLPPRISSRLRAMPAARPSRRPT
jgi:hypothetical protein